MRQKKVKVIAAIDIGGILQFRRDGSKETAQDHDVARDLESKLYKDDSPESIDQSVCSSHPSCRSTK